MLHQPPTEHQAITASMSTEDIHPTLLATVVIPLARERLRQSQLTDTVQPTHLDTMLIRATQDTLVPTSRFTNQVDTQLTTGHTISTSARLMLSHPTTSEETA